ncbi:hypothetical protein K474DRAFT_915928 [Panus rudis PR-1116 ss-1]|nr:hypothetical protein K474DRAFT_915928 [Panus rudis PR-1116 ss-1]
MPTEAGDPFQMAETEETAANWAECGSGLLFVQCTCVTVPMDPYITAHNGPPTNNIIHQERRGMKQLNVHRGLSSCRWLPLHAIRRRQIHQLPALKSLSVRSWGAPVASRHCHNLGNPAGYSPLGFASYKCLPRADLIARLILLNGRLGVYYYKKPSHTRSEFLVHSSAIPGLEKLSERIGNAV